MSGSAEQPQPEPQSSAGRSSAGAVSAALSRAPGDTRAMAEAERAIQETMQEAASGGSNLDSYVGRLVIDQGLATLEEVQHCIKQKNDESGGDSINHRSLAQLLVENKFITHRQMVRLRPLIDAERSGQQLPGYKIKSKLGAGAMATVYKGVQLSLNREVAIKVLPKKYNTNQQFIERFYAEGQAAAQLNHANIVQAFDVARAGDTHFFVMEYVEGRTVYDDIVKHKRFGEAEAVDIIIEMAEALKHAHEKGLIHRDVKPKNIMISKSGVAKLADMGLARAMSDAEAAEAEKGKAFGTPYYISPEQIRGERDIGPPADIYSLGATFYHMVTGHVPFEGSKPSDVMHKHLKEALVPPDHKNPKLSPGVAEIIEMMMAKEPSRRYKDCADLLIDLQAVKKGEKPIIAHKDTLNASALASVMEAEAAAVVTEVPVDRSQTDTGASLKNLLVIALVFLAISVVANVIQAVV
ncbi:MAG: serine/threonine-protein kinase [Planctomycetota bacterium]